jgi:IS5 family transposase
LRQFCSVYVAPVPDDTTRLRWATLIQPATLHRLLDHVVELARTLQVTRGRTLRMDGTVVATHLHPPTDSTLLYDGVRVLGRTLAKARVILQQTSGVAREAVRDRTRRATRQMKRMMEAARQRGTVAADPLPTAYHRLLDIPRTTVQHAQRVGAVLRTHATQTRQKLGDPVDRLVPLVQQGIGQTTRRVIQGEAVPAPEKGVSLCEPHTAIIRKGKPGNPTEFGRVLWLDEVEGGSISRYAVLEGTPTEDTQLPPSLDHHLRVFKRPPRLLAGDRGGHSTANERYAATHGVKGVVLPKPGAKSAKRIAHEQPRWCRRGRDWRAGIEGRLSGRTRRHGLERCRYHGTDGMERWVGWGVIAHDLRGIAQATTH